MKTSTINVYNPTGTIIAITGSVPDGYLACDGSYVNISDYQKLYNVITNNGTSFPYGANVGSTFALPDLRERTPVGGTQNTLGSTSGKIDADSENLTISASGTFESNYSSTADYTINRGNVTVAAAANTSDHTITSTNMPSHTHGHRSHTIVQICGNTAVSGLNRSSRNTETNIGFGGTQTAQTNTWNRRQNGNSTKVNAQGTITARWAGQSSGDGARIHKSGNTLNSARWTNNNTNTIIWREMVGALGRAHAHQGSGITNSAQYNKGNLATARSSIGTVNINANESNFTPSTPIGVDYGNLEGKQVIVKYVIKY